MYSPFAIHFLNFGLNFLIFMMLSALVLLASFLWEFGRSFERRSIAALFLLTFGGLLAGGLYLIVQVGVSMFSFFGGWDWLYDGWLAGGSAAALVDLGIWWGVRVFLKWLARKVTADDASKDN